MEIREAIIEQWFHMWIQKRDLGIQEIFAEEAVYIESWGPEYHGAEKIKLWFDEWNTRGTVLTWKVKQFFHKNNQTIVEWYFKNKMNDGIIEAFEGISLIQWTEDNRICFLKNSDVRKIVMIPIRMVQCQNSGMKK